MNPLPPSSIPIHAKQENAIETYIRSLDPEDHARLTSPEGEVAELMEGNVAGMLGGLPEQNFSIEIKTSRENLGLLLTAAMHYGYFLHKVEQRMLFEKSLLGIDDAQNASPPFGLNQNEGPDI